LEGEEKSIMKSVMEVDGEEDGDKGCEDKETDGSDGSEKTDLVESDSDSQVSIRYLCIFWKSGNIKTCCVCE